MSECKARGFFRHPEAKDQVVMITAEKMSHEGGANKVRVDISVSADTKTLLDAIIADEVEEDRSRDRPERSKSEILEMVLRKGCRTWKQERE
jgi:hypothetical protein